MLVKHGPNVAIELEEYEEHFEANIDFKERLIGENFKEIAHTEMLRQISIVIMIYTPIVLFFSVFCDLVDFEVLMTRQLHKVICKALKCIFGATEVVVSEH